MNVNDYTNDDLLKIIGFDTDSDYQPSVYLINSKIDSLIVKMQQEGKGNFVSFFENIRLKLLSNNEEEDEEDEEQEEDEEDEDEDEDDEDEDEDDEDEDDEEQEEQEDEEQEDEEQEDEDEETKDVKEFLNRDNTKNATQIFNIDTRFRSEYYNTLSTSFTFELPEIQKNVVSIRLASIEMPITYYSVSNTLGNNSMLILSNDQSYNDTTSITQVDDASYNFITDTSTYPYVCDDVPGDFKNSVTKKAWLTYLPDGNYDLALSNISNTEKIINDAISLSIPGVIDNKGRFAKFTNPDNNHWLNNNYITTNNAASLQQQFITDISAIITQTITDISDNVDFDIADLSSSTIQSIIAATIATNNARREAITGTDTITPNYHFKCSIDKVSKKTVFAGVYDSSSNKYNPKKISGFMFNVDSKGNLDTNTNIQTKLGWTLGYRGAEYIIGSEEPSSVNIDTPITSVSEGVPFLSGSRYCFLSVNEYANNSRPSFLVAYNNSTMSDNILARISLTGSTNNLGSRDSGFTHTSNRTREYFSPVDIKRLTINLYDEYGRIIDLNNMDWSFTLAIEKKLN